MALASLVMGVMLVIAVFLPRVYSKMNCMEKVIEKFGQPNVVKNFYSNNGYEIYYELVSEDGKPLYADISAEYADHGKIYSFYLCTDKETLYDN